MSPLTTPVPLGAEVLLALTLDVVFEKRCDTCRANKALAAFPPHRGSKDGHRTTCSDCLLSGRYTPYIEPPEYRAIRKARQSQPEWQASHREALERWQMLEAVRAQATKAVRTTVATGRLAQSVGCQVHGCNSRQFIEAHHWTYDADRWLDVLWCCAAHHREGHARGFIIPAAGIAARYGLIPGLDQDEAERRKGERRRTGGLAGRSHVKFGRLDNSHDKRGGERGSA